MFSDIDYIYVCVWYDVSVDIRKHTHTYSKLTPADVNFLVPQLPSICFL